MARQLIVESWNSLQKKACYMFHIGYAITSSLDLCSVIIQSHETDPDILIKLEANYTSW